MVSQRPPRRSRHDTATPALVGIVRCCAWLTAMTRRSSASVLLVQLVALAAVLAHVTSGDASLQLVAGTQHGVKPHVPRFAGKPCAATGSCPLGPNCTVCGAYCGPGWCGDACVNEGASCDFSVDPQDGSCTDACCRAHDWCCGCMDGDGSGSCDKSSCNSLLAECLRSCSWNDGCTGDDGRWGPNVIHLVFQLDKRRCCGSRCPDDPPDGPPSL